jgi:hypothetical protein
LKRPESKTRLQANPRPTFSREKASASLSRTQGKRASRIIFTDKTETPTEAKPVKSHVHKPASNQFYGYQDKYSSGASKSGITTFLDHKAAKPVVPTSLSKKNYFGESASNSNFPTKISVARESTDESTRDETKISKSSYFSKIESNSKLLLPMPNWQNLEFFIYLDKLCLFPNNCLVEFCSPAILHF